MPETADIRSFLRSVLPIEKVHEQLFDVLVASTTVEKRRAGEYIFFEGDKGDRGYYVMDGRIALRKSSPNGKELIVALLPSGEPFGTLAAIDRRPFPLSAQAQSAATILSFPAQPFAALLESDPSASRALLSMLGERLRASHELSRALAHDRVEVRVAAALLSLRPRVRGQDPNDLLLGRQELADAVGITIETATRTMKAFEHEGIVDLTKLGKVRLLAPERLHEILEAHG